MEKIITVKGEPKVETAKNGNKYLAVFDTSDERYFIYEHKDKWAIIKDGFNIKLIGEQKGKYFNAEDFELVAPDSPILDEPLETIPFPKTTPPPSSTMSKDDWAEKDRIKDSSIEAQVAHKKGIDLLCTYIAANKEVDLKTLQGKYIKYSVEWGIARLGHEAEVIIEKAKEA